MVTGCCMHLRLGSQEDSDRHASLAKKKRCTAPSCRYVASALSRSRGSTGTPVQLSERFDLHLLHATQQAHSSANTKRNPAKLATASRTKPVDSPLTDASPFVLFKRQFNNPNSDHAQNPNPEQQYKTAAPGEPELAASTNPNT